MMTHASLWPSWAEHVPEDDLLTGVDGRIPTSTYPWSFNVGRQRMRDGRVQRWAYVPTGSDEAKVPARFAERWGGAELR